MNENGLTVKGDEGARVRALKESLNHAVEKLLGGSKASLYAKCFPSMIPENEAVLEAVRVSLLDKVRAAIYEDLQLLIDDVVAEPLEQLGELVKNYSGPKDIQAWRPTGDPMADIRAHDAKVLKHEKQRLLEALTHQQKKSEELLQQVKAGREQCQTNSTDIQKRLAVLSQVTGVCNTIPKNYLISYHEGACTDFEQ